MLASGIIFSQTGRVGINTESPKTTLDVTGKTDNTGVSLTTDITGLQAPRLTREELTNKGNSLYGTDQKGALIYISNISGGDANLQRVNITSIGYYYFDGVIWQKINSGNIANTEPWFDQATQTPATGNTQNIYQMGNVGIGTSSVAGAKVEAFTTNTNSASFKATDGNGHILLIPLLGFGSFNAISSSGDVGIIFSTDNDGSTDANNGLVIAPHTSGGAGTNKGMKIMENGLIGIGASNPTERLDIGVGNVRVRDINTNLGTAATDKIVVADANGVLKTIPKQNALLFGGDLLDAVATTTSTAAASSASAVSTNLKTVNFTVDYPSLVTFDYTLSYSIPNIGTLSDGFVRRIAAGLFFTTSATPSIPTNQSFAFNSLPLTVTGASGNIPGFYYFTGSQTLKLNAGTYDITLFGNVRNSGQSAVPFSVEFGSAPSDFIAITAKAIQ